MRASKKTFFLRNFRRIFRIFGEFSEFSANFWNFRRKKTKKSLVLRISRYTIWEGRYDILFDIRKSPISRHSINSRYDKLLATIPLCFVIYIETDLEITQVRLAKFNMLRMLYMCV